MKNKLFLLAVAGFCALGLFTGCGGSDSTDSTEETLAENAAAGDSGTENNSKTVDLSGQDLNDHAEEIYTYMLGLFEVYTPEDFALTDDEKAQLEEEQAAGSGITEDYYIFSKMSNRAITDTAEHFNLTEDELLSFMEEYYRENAESANSEEGENTTEEVTGGQ